MTTLENEIWKDYPKFKGLYRISNYGRVGSFYTRNSHIGKNMKILNPKLQKYYRIILCKDMVQTELLVHRMVAKVFVKNTKPSVYNQVNHKDGNKINNYYKNLEWCDERINRRHAFNTGLQKPLQGEKAWKATLTNIQVSKIKTLLSKGIKTSEIANKFDISMSKLYSIKNGHAWRSVQ